MGLGRSLKFLNFMTQTYKFNIGDKVDYPKTIYMTKTCHKCGHEDTQVIFKPATGVITHRKYSVMYRVDSIPLTSETLNSNVPSNGQGKIFHKPYMTLPKVNEPEPVYTVGGEWLRENELQLNVKPNGKRSQKG